VSVCFFGDGACNNGTFHESVNIAAVQDLPVVFVCENNLYATVTAVHEATRTEDFADRAAGYGIPGVIVDGNDVLNVLEETDRAVARAREGEGPSLLECKTYRHFGHYVGEPGTRYRTPEEVEEWKKRDPIEGFCKHLQASGVIDARGIRMIEQQVEQEVLEAVEFARGSDHPDPESAADHVWSGR
jgi:TPP-dependent pyruvate/acetoin dehydrogenase alpha subunit